MKSFIALCLTLLLLFTATTGFASSAETTGYNNGKSAQHRKVVKHRRARHHRRHR
jgi:hypothetical protein